jgi:Tetrapyrrole (Corrin/Porphyrin) Methylases
MKNQLNDFLISLARDSTKLAEFEKDPDGVLANSGLSQEEKEIIKSRNPHLIRQASFKKPAGSLTIVGIGIKLVAHQTMECRNSIQSADRVLYAAAEGASGQWIQSLNPKCESLDLMFQPGKPRSATYDATVERILSCVRDGERVCVAYYGHPGVFVNATHAAYRRAKEEGFSARMLPGISAEDCLFADLGVDPGRQGYQSFDATTFLSQRKRFSVCNPLVLWQIGMIGETGYKPAPNREGLKKLSAYLLTKYSENHFGVIYEAAQYPITQPLIRKIKLSDLSRADIASYSTLFVPVEKKPVPDPEMLKRLGLA